MKCIRQNCYVSFNHFCPFNPVTARKLKIPLKMENKHRDVIIYTCEPKIMTIRYTVSDIWHVIDLLAIFHFKQYFPLSPPNSPKNENFKKKKKKKKTPGDHHFTHKLLPI